MCDVDDRLGVAIAAIVRASRALSPNHLDGLLENIGVEVGAAMMEEDARRKAAQLRDRPAFTIVPKHADEASTSREKATRD
jgi:hypothetical protein